MRRFVIHPGVSRLLVLSMLASAFGLTARCHGSRLDDGVAVALVGPDFLGKWGTPARSLDDLFFILRTPRGSPTLFVFALPE